MFSFGVFVSVGERIKALRLKAALTQQKVAAHVGVSRAAVTQWEQDLTTPSGTSVHALAELLGCSTGYILHGDSYQETEPAHLYKVPLISSIQAGYWAEGTEEEPSAYCHTAERFPDGSFALTVRGDSMTDSEGAISIPDGSKVIVVPDLEAVHGRIVVAMLEGSNEATIKKLVIDGPMKYLVPLNKRYPPMPINGNCRIVGRVKQVINIQNL